MTPQRRRQLQRSAAKLLELLGTVEAPIPVERLAQLRGAKIRFVPTDDDISGVLFREDGRAIIGVNALHSPTRQRFTIAHELGHLELHENSEVHVDRSFRVYSRNQRSSEATDVREIEANAFAAEVLIPASLVEKDLARLTVDYEDDEVIRRLAERYKVSPQAMTIRLTNLGFLHGG